LVQTLKIIVVAAIVSLMVLSVIPSAAQAGTDGTAMKFLAKGTLWDGYGHVRASDVWFTFSISSTDPHVLTLGNNSNDVHYMNLRTFGSGGTISNMSGPDEWIEDSWFVAALNITALYEYGVSKISVVLRAPGGVVMSTGPNADTSSGDSTLEYIILFTFALFFIGLLMVVSRIPPT
jgi:hypothetical protein